MSVSGEKPKIRVATASLAGCFGCHMSLLDIDENLFSIMKIVEFDRSPITDIKHCGVCDVGILEGGVCNTENVHVLQEFRKNCKILVAMGACAINGGLPAQRNNLDIRDILASVYARPERGVAVPNDPEIPLLLDSIHPLHEIVRIDYFLPGCPPSGEAILAFLEELLAGETPTLPTSLIRYD